MRKLPLFWARIRIRRFTVGSMALFALSGVLACNGTTEGTEDEALCHLDEGPQFAPGAVTQADIYLDNSKTMAGFISDAENPIEVTPLQQLLESLLVERLNDAALVPSFHTFGLNVDPATPLSELRKYVRDRTYYNKLENDIVAALLKASERPSSLSIIVTDNTQDVLTTKQGRALGFDRSGIVRAVSENLAGKGFGVWLLAFQSGFEGEYFSVRLTLEPGGVRTNRRFPVLGERPVYCWIISRDWDKGRSLAVELHEELSRLAPPGEGGASQVHGIEFFPGIVPSLSADEPDERELAPPAVDSSQESLSPTQGALDFFRVRSWTSYPGNPRVSIGELVFQQPRTTEILFLLKTRLALPRDRETSLLGLPLRAWNVVPQEPLDLGARLAREIRHFEAQDQQTMAPGNDAFTYWELAIPYDRLVSQPRERWSLAIPLLISTDLRSVQGSNWLKDWSTEDDTSPDAIRGKTIYLGDVMHRIIERTVGRRRPHGCLALKFARQ